MKRWSALAVLFAVLAGSAPALQAQGHRARLSQDLAQHLAEGSNGTVDVIVQGTQQHLQRLARRYNLKVKRRIRSGGVLEVTGGQLDALSQDPDVAHLSLDAVVRSTMAVTTQSIGADQAWAGSCVGSNHCGPREAVR